MQIRLSVLAARDGAASTRARVQAQPPAQAADVLVTAPVGTTLGAVAGALAGAVGARPGSRSGRKPTHIHLYAGDQRLDERTVLGHPPLVYGVVLRLDEPDPDHADDHDPGSPAELRVAGGPDAGGIHLLLPGRVRVGRSADADVPLDDPDVSRLHLVLEVAEDGRVTVADLGSTNGTALDGLPVGADPVPVPPGGVVSLGESALTVTRGNHDRRRSGDNGATGPLGRGELLPDGQGHLLLARRPAVQMPAPAGPRNPVGATSGGTGSGAPADPQGSGRAKGLLARGGERLLRGAKAGLNGSTAPTDPGSAPDGSGRVRSEPPGTGIPDPGGAGRDGGATSRGTGPGAAPTGRPGQGTTPPHGVRLPAARTAPGRSAESDARRRPDPAEMLHTALGPGPRLWERGTDHPDALVLRLGSADQWNSPVGVDLRTVGSLGLTGPQPRLAGLARALIAQLAVLHGPGTLELVLVAADQARSTEERVEEWSWMFWLPQLVPTRGQACRLLTALDPEQATARLAELDPLTLSGGAGRAGFVTVLVVDGDPGSAEARAEVERLLAYGPAQGVHVLALAERADLLPHGCGATAAVTGEVGTLLTLERPVVGPDPHLAELDAAGVLTTAAGHGGQHRAAPPRELLEGIVLDAVSAPWAARLARALSPLREPDSSRRPGRSALPEAPRLLDLLGLDLVTPAKLAGRWEELQVGSGTLPTVLIGADRAGDCALDLSANLLIGGAPGSGRTELLRALLASLTVSERPDRLGILLVEGRPSTDPTGGLRPCVDLPHVTDHVDGTDGRQLLHAARSLLSELDRRDLLLQGRSFASWHAERALDRHHGNTERAVAHTEGAVSDTASVLDRGSAPSGSFSTAGGYDSRPYRSATPVLSVELVPPRRAADDYPVAPATGAPLAQLLVVVDDHDELLLPGRERAALAAALDAVAVRGPRLGVHLVVSTGRPDRSSGTELDEAAHLRIALRTEDARLSSLLIHVDDAATVPEDRPGRGYIRHTDGGVTPFQAARVSGRIPRTATLRPTVAPLDWALMGDPPARRPVRELGNGPTDLALLASALQRAADTSAAGPVAPLL